MRDNYPARSYGPAPGVGPVPTYRQAPGAFESTYREAPGAYEQGRAQGMVRALIPSPKL